MEPSMKLRGGQVIPDEFLRGEIQFKNVTFAYPTRKKQVVHLYIAVIYDNKEKHVFRLF